MRLERFTVKKYRSIIAAEKLPVGDLTVLVGPNNEGKSNILDALVVGMQELAMHGPRPPRLRSRKREHGGYSWERDFPQSLQAGESDGRTLMHFDFGLTEEEIAEFREAVGSHLNGILPVSLSFGPGRAAFAVRKQRHSAALSAKRDEIAAFIGERVQVQYVPAVRNAERAAGIVQSMVRRELRAATRDEEYAAAARRLRELQTPVLERISASITEKVRGVLPDVRAITFELDDEDRGTFDTGWRQRLIVDDGSPTDLDLKGDGVQSLATLALIQHYSTTTARAKEFILAIEEPEAHLHPQAIHALRQVLRDTAESQQVVLTTHSPLFVNRLDLDSNIVVEKARARPASSVKELREVLGVRTSDNLESAEVVLVVEGEEDVTALRAILGNRSSRLRDAITNGTLTLYPLRGGSNLGYLIRLLQDSLAAIQAFLDNDHEGHSAAAAAEKEGLLDMRDRSFAVYPGKPESEFEDLISPAAYAEAFQREFAVDVNVNLGRVGRTAGKWSSRMGLIFNANGQLWNDDVKMRAKSALASAVSDAPGAAILPDAESVIEALVAALDSKLEARG